MKDESYTPTFVIDCARAALGGVIDLDPTSNGLGGIATNAITAEQDCFATEWQPLLGRDRTVFLNPPYSTGGKFVEELWRYLDDGVVTAAITLTLPGLMQNKASSWMFSSEYCRVLAHPVGRIQYINSGTSNPRDALFALWTGKHVDPELIERRFVEQLQNLTAPIGSGSRINGCLITRPMPTPLPAMQTRLAI